MLNVCGVESGINGWYLIIYSSFRIVSRLSPCPGICCTGGCRTACTCCPVSCSLPTSTPGTPGSVSTACTRLGVSGRYVNMGVRDVFARALQAYLELLQLLRLVSLTACLVFVASFCVGWTDILLEFQQVPQSINVILLVSIQVSDFALNDPHLSFKRRSPLLVHQLYPFNRFLQLRALVFGSELSIAGFYSFFENFMQLLDLTYCFGIRFEALHQGVV